MSRYKVVMSERSYSQTKPKTYEFTVDSHKKGRFILSRDLGTHIIVDIEPKHWWEFWK